MFIWVSIHQPTERTYAKEHVCIFDRLRREREGQSQGGSVRSRPRLSSPECLDWLKKTNPSGQAVGWRQTLPGPPPLLLLYTKLFQMIYCCSPFWDWLLLTFHSPEQRLTGGSPFGALWPIINHCTPQVSGLAHNLIQVRSALPSSFMFHFPTMQCGLVLQIGWLLACEEGCVEQSSKMKISTQLWAEDFHLHFSFYNQTLMAVSVATSAAISFFIFNLKANCKELISHNWWRFRWLTAVFLYSKASSFRV